MLTTTSELQLNRNGQVHIFCTAGYSKKSPKNPVAERQASLAHQLLRLVATQYQYWSSRFTARPLCWGTSQEILYDIRLACENPQILGSKDVTLVIATNATHLPRVWMNCMLYKPKGWKLIAKRAHHPFPWHGRFWELSCLKIFHDLKYYFLTGRKIAAEYKTRINAWKGI